MTDDLSALQAETDAALASCADLRAWDAVRVGVLGRNGTLTGLLRDLGKAPPEQRRERGAALNRLKDALAAAIEARRVALEAADLHARLAAERQDPTLPPRPRPAGLIHPISRTMEEMAAIFGAMGFEIAEGPDVETDWHNFSALNIPAHHPARDDQDTFYLTAPESGPPPVLRTHTSPVQVRTMLQRPLPFRVIVPGRTYRADHDATHSPMFHQCEGLVLDRNITLGHLKGCLIDFLRAFFAVADPAGALPGKLLPVHRALDGSGYRLGPEIGRARQGHRTGWRSWAAGWCIRACWRTWASIRGSGRDLPSAWGWNG